jgi:hypothetical protein
MPGFAQPAATRHAVEFVGLGRTQVEAASETSITFGAGSSALLGKWIGDFINKTPSRRTGFLFTLSARGEPLTQTGFTRAVVTEVAFPALDATSRDTARVTLGFKAERTEPQDGGGLIAVPGKDYEARMRRWLASAFRLHIDGIDASRVSRVEALVFRQGSAQVPVYPRLVIHLPPADAAGLSASAGPRSGRLEFLSADRRAVFTLRFDGMLPVRVDPPQPGARHARAELTVAGAELSSGQ